MLVKCFCQTCNGHLEFDSTISGQTVNCPHCGIETLLYIPNIPNPPHPPTPKKQTSAKSVRFPAISKIVFPKPNLQNLVYLAAGSVAALVIMVVLGAIKPLGTWHSTELGQDLNGRGVAREKNNNEIPVSEVYSDVASVIRLNGDLPTIKFPTLWADTERYFVQPFLFSGTVKTPEYP